MVQEQSGIRIPVSRRILVVEDDADVRLLLTRALGRHHTIILAQNGYDALDVALRRPPDLFVLDVMLPGLDGLELAERIRDRRRLKDVPILFLTARNSAQDAMRALALGVRDYMTKPFRISDMVERVDRLLGGSTQPAKTRERVSIST